MVCPDEGRRRRAVEQGTQAPPERMVVCGACSKEVPESARFYPGDGLRCDASFEEDLP